MIEITDDDLAPWNTGTFELTVDGVLNKMSAGHYVVIPPDVVHSGHSVTTCKIIDVF